MQQRVLLYLHGLGSSGRSDTGMFLREHFADSCVLSCPDYRPQFFHESVEFIDSLLESLRAPERRIAILGSSMGGWHALHALARHRDITVLALNPALDPASIRRSSSPDDVDHQSGEALDWPEIVAENFPPVPVANVAAERVRVLVGGKDDVVPPEPTLRACKEHHWSHRVFSAWGHRAELGPAMQQEIDALLIRAGKPCTTR